MALFSTLCCDRKKTKEKTRYHSPVLASDKGRYKYKSTIARLVGISMRRIIGRYITLLQPRIGRCKYLGLTTHYVSLFPTSTVQQSVGISESKIFPLPRSGGSIPRENSSRKAHHSAYVCIM